MPVLNARADGAVSCFLKLALGVAAAAVLSAPSDASAFSPYLVVPEPAVAEASPAYRYANMTDAAAYAELDRRAILYSKVDHAPGVRAPIRLTGRLHGVYVHSSLPPEQRVTSLYEILDARLALALDDFCALLERHDVDEVVHYTMYRPNVAAPRHELPDLTPLAVSKTPGSRPRPPIPTKLSPNAKPMKAAQEHTPSSAKQKTADDTTKPEPGTVWSTSARAKPAAAKEHAKPAKAPTKAAPIAGVTAGKRTAHRDPIATGLHQTTWAPPGTRHPAGLAIDVALLHRRDGRWLSVQRDFHGRIGAKTCGEGAPAPDNADGRELHSLVCESSDLGLFTYVLTPDYNAAHFDHFHMEIKPGVKWFLYH